MSPGELGWAGAGASRAGGPGCAGRLPAFSRSLSCLARGGWKEGGRRERSKNERAYSSCACGSAGWESLVPVARQAGQVGALPASGGFSRLGHCLGRVAAGLSVGSLRLSPCWLHSSWCQLGPGCWGKGRSQRPLCSSQEPCSSGVQHWPQQAGCWVAWGHALQWHHHSWVLLAFDSSLWLSFSRLFTADRIPSPSASMLHVAGKLL